MMGGAALGLAKSTRSEVMTSSASIPDIESGVNSIASTAAKYFSDPITASISKYDTSIKAVEDSIYKTSTMALVSTDMAMLEASRFSVPKMMWPGGSGGSGGRDPWGIFGKAYRAKIGNPLTLNLDDVLNGRTGGRGKSKTRKKRKKPGRGR